MSGGVTQGPAWAQGKPVLVTGGAGFVGTNLADRIVRQGGTVILYDNLSRAGVERNLDWLKRTHGDKVVAEVADIRDADRLADSVSRSGAVFHLAAQVAVTTSLTDPRTDFEVNALGTLNLLEAVRAHASPPPLIFSSTNKVYGSLPDLTLAEEAERYQPTDHAQAVGVGEGRPLDFHSPYGCSKGAADQYVVDYARSYGLPAAVFRMSCIYGPHQFGTEDQGWVAHFLIAALERKPVTLFGTGRQVRDILHVNDLVDAFILGMANMDRLAGQACNIGGGADNAVSLRQVLDIIGRLDNRPVEVSYGPWRVGDQPWYVADSAKFRALTGWEPAISATEGIEQLYWWLKSNRIDTAPDLPAAWSIPAVG